MTIKTFQKFTMTPFTQNYDQTIRDLEQKLEEIIDSGIAFDFSRSGDVLTIEFDNGEKIIITPQAPMEQLWISANYAGHRFNWKDDNWVNEKGGQEFSKFLTEALSLQLGMTVEI
jgi:CyaY protein